jgi:hypothetical protein
MASSFTSEEIEMINNIKEGTKKLIENVLLKELKSPKKYANKQALTKIRPSTHAFLIREIIEIFRKDKNYIFRPIDLKKRLPESLKVIEDYDSELSRILQSLIRSNLIVQSSRLPPKRGPGHPMRNEGRNYTTSGPKSYYEASPYLIKIITIMDNPESSKIIFHCLSKSNMLFDLYEKSNLIYPNLLKQNRFKAGKMLRETTKLETSKTESDFKEQFEKDKEKIKNMKRKEITQEAKYWAKKKLNILTPHDFMWLYPLGASYYIMHIISTNND